MLTPTDHTILAIESQRWKFPAAKEARALELLGMTPTRYYQRRDALLDHPAAEATHPALIHHPAACVTPAATSAPNTKPPAPPRER